MGEAPTASMGGGGVGLIAATGVEAAGPEGGGGATGGAAGIALSAAGGGGGGGAAAAGSAGFGASALGFAGAAPTAPALILAKAVPGLTVAPSSTKRASMTPEQGDGTGTEVLSVSISQITSSSATESPTAFSQRRSPSVMDSAKAGHLTTTSSSRHEDVLIDLN